jgi:hypothetical protein
MSSLIEPLLNSDFELKYSAFINDVNDPKNIVEDGIVYQII